MHQKQVRWKMELKKINITEAFAESMPASIRAFLLSGRGRRWISQLVGDKNLALEKANFIKYDIPKTNRDPIFKDDTKIKFYVFNNGAVYITTVNDDWQYIAHNGSVMYNKWLPAKALIENSKEIYYLDITDPNNFNTDKKASRTANKVGDSPYYRTQDVQNDRNVASDKKWQIRRGKLTVDKSGYIIDPNRLAKKMVELGLFDPAKKLKAIHKKIVNMKNDLMEAMSEVSIDRAGIQVADNIRWAMSEYSRAIQSYNELVQNIDMLQDQKNRNILDNKVFAQNARSMLENYTERIDSRLHDVEGYISKFVGVAVDWDTDDEEN